MAVHIKGIFPKEINDKINASKILVVGAGGIGCELMKNLVTTGFENITVIDLDTIDLSNLNRQFLFHKQHISKPKAIVARETVLKFNPNANIKAIHDTITNPDFDIAFYSQFSAVANALDNVAARSHVNRMCLAAEIPLIESGTAGYVGQVTVYKKGISECFECLPRPAAKTYPGCTIRNTPSEPVHCIVWAKHLFNQLFGESDADEEVSPDMADPSLATQPEENAGNVSRISTKEWAKTANYDPLQIFNKLFGDDIEYLNKMNDLWVNRKRPQKLNYDKLPDSTPGPSRREDARIKDQRIWSIKQCGEIFCKSLTSLKNRLGTGEIDMLLWDKDDEECLDFVASCANLRSYCFGIPQKTRFDIKAIAGNIIPAIATTNAVIAGLIVLQIIKVLKGDFSKCKNAWLKASGIGGKILPSSQLEKPNPKCMVCSSSIPEVKVMLDVKTLTIRTLSDKILIEKLHMAKPDAMLNDGSGRIVISSDPEDKFGDEMMEKTLSDFGVLPSTKILCEDFLQHYSVQLIIVASNSEVKDQEFIIETDVDKLIEQQQKEPEKLQPDKTDAASNNCETIDEDDIVMIDADTLYNSVPLSDIKRKLTEDENGHELHVEKRRKTLRL